MAGLDPRWLEILKASGWQTTALTLACAVIGLLVSSGFIPTDGSPYWISISIVGTVVFGFLSLAAIGDALNKAYNPIGRLKYWHLIRRQQNEAEEFIPYMTEQDKQIIGYLLYHNQKMFQTEDDGGYAAALISRGIIRPVGKHGQIMDLTRVPFEIPNHIWKVLESHRDRFPYSLPPKGETETHPWAIPWMVR